MTKLLFLPSPNTLVWLEIPQSPEELLEAIAQNRWLPPPPFEDIPIDSLQAVCQGEIVTVSAVPPGPDDLPRLSRRQQAVLSALVSDLTYRQIAYRLDITPRMVKYHVAELKTRFAAQTRAELIQKGLHWLAHQPAGAARHT